MKLSIIGDIAEGKEEAALRTIKAFVEDHRGGNCVLIAAGSVKLIRTVDNLAMDRGFPCIILGNVSQLAVLNADKVLLMQTKALSLVDMVAFCKANNKVYMLIK